MYTKSLEAERDFYYELRHACSELWVKGTPYQRRQDGIPYQPNMSPEYFASSYTVPCPKCKNGIIRTSKRLKLLSEHSWNEEYWHVCEKCGGRFNKDDIRRRIFERIPREMRSFILTPVGPVYVTLNGGRIPIFKRVGAFSYEIFPRRFQAGKEPVSSRYITVAVAWGPIEKDSEIQVETSYLLSGAI